MNIKSLLAAIIVVMSSFTLYAQDIISMRNGDIIKANIREISKTEIKYNKVSNPNGPLFIVDKNDVKSILYDNGEQEIFEENIVPSEQRIITNVKNKASDKNAKLIKSINEAQITHDKSIGGIKNSNVTAIWGIEENSLLSDETLTLSFEKFVIEESEEKIEGYRFKLTNDSPHTVYVDLTNSFFGNSTTGSSPFFKNKTYSQVSSSGNNVGFNVGALSNALGVGGVVGALANGISIGSEKTNGNMVSESESPILIIPPYSFTYLPCEKVLKGKEWIDMPNILYFYTKRFSRIDDPSSNTFRYMRNSFDSKKLKVDNSEVTAYSIGLRKNSLVEFSPETSPKKYTIFLAYVLDGDTSNIYKMSINLYLRGLFGEKIEFKKSYVHSDFLIYGPAYIVK